MIHSHLEPGARLIFDLNGEEAFIRFWNDINAIVEPKTVRVLRSEYQRLPGWQNVESLYLSSIHIGSGRILRSSKPATRETMFVPRSKAPDLRTLRYMMPKTQA